MDSPPTGRPVTKTLACVRCRTSKVKCDGDNGKRTGVSKPCSGCVKIGETCVFAPRKRPAPRVDNNRNTITRLNNFDGDSVVSVGLSFSGPGNLYPVVSPRSRDIGSVQADLDWLVQRHWFVPKIHFLGPGSQSGSAVAVAGHYPSPTGSFVAAALKVVPAFQAFSEAAVVVHSSGTSGNSFYTGLARNLRGNLEPELARLLGYISLHNPNPAASDLSLLFALTAIAQFFAATGHVQFANKIIDASNGLVRRVKRKLGDIQDPHEIGGPALLHTWLRATWINVHLEFNRALVTGKPQQALELVEEVSTLRFPEPMHVWIGRELRKREVKAGITTSTPEPVVLPPLTFGELTAVLFDVEPGETRAALLASHYGLLQHRGPLPLASAAEYLAILAGSFCEHGVSGGGTGISMIDLLTNGQLAVRPAWSPEQSQSDSPGSTGNNGTKDSLLAPLLLTRWKIIMAVAGILAALPEPVRLADEAGDLVALARIADTWWYPAGQNGMPIFIPGLLSLHLASMLVHSPRPFSDTDLWTSEHREGPEWSAWLAWIGSIDFVEACTHAIIIARYAKSFIRTIAAKTVADGGYHIAIAAAYPSPVTTLCILTAAWVLTINVSVLKHNTTREGFSVTDPAHVLLALEVEADARACLDFALTSPWKQFHQPAAALQRMLITPLLGPKEEDLAIFKHAIDSDRL